MDAGQTQGGHLIGVGVRPGQPDLITERALVALKSADRTPAPGRMILAALGEVPGGEPVAQRTTNARLGRAGGISILRTTGLVRPCSTAAYPASVVQQIDVPAAQGERFMVLCTGSRSEQAALRQFPDLDPVAVVEVGNCTGVALRRCRARQLPGFTDRAIGVEALMVDFDGDAVARA